MSEVSIQVTPPAVAIPNARVTRNDMLRWECIMNALRGADQYCLQGGRGVLNKIWYRHPDYPMRRLSLPAHAPYRVGPTTCGSTYTDVER